MLKSVAAAAKLVDDELEQLRLNVFERPPSDWAGFQLLMGSYQALSRLAAELSADPIHPEDKS